MSVLSDLHNELEDNKTLRSIAAAFTEVNAYRIKKIRASFEKNYRFYKEITDIYHLVKETAAVAAGLPAQAGGGRKGEPLKETVKPRFAGDKSLRIAVTSNSHFFGNLNRDVIDKFLVDARKTKDDLMVIGQTGISLAALKIPPSRFQSFRFKSDFPSREEIVSVINATSDYARVYLYYPQFVNMLTQKVYILDITQSAPPQKSTVANIDHIFEPEVGKIVEFFEKQVRSLLFIRAMLETDLSRTAARLISMSGAEQRAEVLIRQRGYVIGKFARSERNARLLETFSGMTKWGNVI